FNLGSDYVNRIGRDRADNLEKAIAAFELALTVFTRETSPGDWAAAQGSLGIAYRDRILGDQLDNLEKAIAAHEHALKVDTREAFPDQHLTTATSLGIVLLKANRWSAARTALDSARDAFLQLFGKGLDEAEASRLVTAAGPLFADAAF